jgi:hypothetical protein
LSPAQYLNGKMSSFRSPRPLCDAGPSQGETASLLPARAARAGHATGPRRGPGSDAIGLDDSLMILIDSVGRSVKGEECVVTAGPGVA